jgi:hypothetical protein
LSVHVESDRPAPTFFHRSDPLTPEGHRWKVFHPRREGAWPGFLENADGDRRYGLYEPETDGFRAVAPDGDPALAAAAPWFDRGEVVSYRVGRRATIRFGAGEDEAPRYAAVLPPGEAATLAEAARAVRAARDVAPPDHPDVAPLLEAFPDQGVLVFGALRGSSLHDLVLGRRFDMDTVLPVVARSIAAFHATPAEAVGVSTRSSGPRPDEFAALATMHFPDRREAYGFALERLERIPRQIGSPPGGCLVHGDLHDRNVLVSGRWVGLLDLAAVCAGHPAEDVGSLAAHLLLSTLMRGARVRTGRRVVRCLLRGYREAGGDIDSRHVSAAGAQTLFRLSCLYLFRRRWQGLTPALLDESVRWSNWARGHVA